MTGAAARIRVVIADDHPVVREGLRAILAQEADIEVVAQASGGSDAIAQVLRHRPDVALIDLAMPDVHGLEVIARLHEQWSQARLVVFTVYGREEDVHRALAAGAQGFLLKDVRAEQVLEAVRAVAAGRRYLSPAAADRLAARLSESRFTPRELDVLDLLAAGHSNRAIAERLALSETTIKTHLGAILGKLGVRSRSQALLAALRRGLVRARPEG